MRSDQDSRSPFRTTHRNHRRYIVVVSIMLLAGTTLLLTIMRGLAWWVILLVILSTVGLFSLGVRYAPRYWNMGWKGRLSLLLVSSLWLVACLVAYPYASELEQSANWLLRFIERAFASTRLPFIDERAIGVFVLMLMILIYSPGLLLSHRRAHLRYMLAALRQDDIRTRISPTHRPTMVVNQVRDSILSWLSHNAGFLRLLITLVIFAIGGPVLVWLVSNQSNDVFYYLRLGLELGVCALAVHLLIWIALTRPRHLVLPFEAIGDQVDGLVSASHFTTNVFVEELQRIRLLLQTQQVEISDFGAEGGVALFVSSGYPQDLVKRLQSYADIRVGSNVRIPLGPLYGALIERLAKSTVHGYIQRRPGGDLSIWVELSDRDGSIRATDTVVVASDENEQIDKRSLREATEKLAREFVLKIGDTTDFATTKKSFELFLGGLDASRKGDWWDAASYYRRAIHIEKTERGSFGLGHYHLGAALLFQGEHQFGLEHLNTARASAPPMAETHYMVGLANLFLHADVLDDPDVFEQIEVAIKTACRMRKHFPEAYRLWGVIYYLRGRLAEDRRQSKNPFRQAKSDYRKAEKLLRVALRQYTKTLRQCDRSLSHPYEASKTESLRIMDEYMATAHRLGDALRAQKLYSEADSFYDDVVEAHPQNIRTLIDRAKTYCLAQNWQRAHEYLRNRVLAKGVAYWQPEANLYMAWITAGGILSEPDHTFNLGKYHYQLGKTISLGDGRELFSSAFSMLDYAFAMQPHLASRSRETNWLPQFLTTACILSDDDGLVLHRYRRFSRRLFRLVQWGMINFYVSMTGRERSDSEEIWCMLARLPNSKKGPLGPEGKTEQWLELIRKADDLRSPLAQMRWIGWRLDSSGVDDSFHREKADEDIVIRVLGDCPDNRFIRQYDALKRGIKQAEHLAGQIKNSGQLYSLANDWARLELADSLEDPWTQVGEYFSEHDDGFAASSLSDRWVVNLYLELTLLRARLLVEGGAYPEASQDIDKAMENFRMWLADVCWRHFWSTACESSNHSDEWSARLHTASQEMTKTWGKRFKEAWNLIERRVSSWADARAATPEDVEQEMLKASRRELWLGKWRETESNLLGNTELPLEMPDWLSPMVLRFQIATLKAWQAYAQFKAREDPSVNLRNVREDGTVAPRQNWGYHRIMDLADQAISECSFQPLASFVRALVQEKKGLLGHAADELIGGLDALTAFDPHVHIASWSRRHRTAGKNEPTFSAITGGLQQFVTVADRANLHAALAKIFTQLGKLDLSIRHLQSAIVWTPFYDADAHYFMRMARNLNSTGELTKGLAAVQEVKRRLDRPDKACFTARQEPIVFESFLYSKSGDIAKAREILEPLQEVPLVKDVLGLLNIPSYFSDLLAEIAELSQSEDRSCEDKSLEDWHRLASWRWEVSKDQSPMIALIQSERSIEVVMLSRIIHAATSEALEVLTQWAKITNNCAYTDSLLHSNLPLALDKSQRSLEVLTRAHKLEKSVREALTTPFFVSKPITKGFEKRSSYSDTVHDLARIKAAYRETFAAKLDTHGWINFRLGNWVEALDDLEKACNLLPDDPDLQYHLARVYIGILEEIWESSTLSRLERASWARRCLRKARYHAHSARRFDVADRLQAQLDRLWRRLTDYSTKAMTEAFPEKDVHDFTLRLQS